MHLKCLQVANQKRVALMLPLRELGAALTFTVWHGKAVTYKNNQPVPLQPLCRKHSVISLHPSSFYLIQSFFAA